MPTCRVCQKDYVYDNDRGYDRELCSPMCDGIEAGRARRDRELGDLILDLYDISEAAKDLHLPEDAASIDEVLQKVPQRLLLAARINRQSSVTSKDAAE